jgi:hypothetical protein
MDAKLFDEIENALDLYIREDHSFPDMKVFSAENAFDPKDVAEVIRTSVLLELSEPQKELLLGSFVKKETEVPKPVVLETAKEWSARRRKEIRRDFISSGLSVQDWLEQHPDVPEIQLRNIIDPNIWKERYVYAPRRDFKELLRVFIEDVPNLSVQQFCTEQSIDINYFRRVVPEEIWQQRYERKRRSIDWAQEIEDMKSSGLCLEDWAYSRGLSPTLFRKKCGEEVAKLYDRYGRRAEAFDPSRSLKENAEALGLTCGGLSAWINTKLRELNPEKFRAFKMDDKDEKIIQLEARVRDLEEELQKAKNENATLKGYLANKNAQISAMQTATSQAKAKGEVFVKQIREALKAFGA